MANVRISCITLSVSHGDHEHITHVGNPAGNWKWPIDDVIRSIDNGTNNFFVLDPRTGKRAEVAVIRPEGRRPYLRTHADGIWNDNLLAQPQCI